MPEQPPEHPHLDRREVRHPLAQPDAAGAGPEVPHLQRLELVGGLGGQQAVADQILDPGQELLVLDHHGLGLEDPGLLHPGPLQHPVPKLVHLGDDVSHRIPQPGHLAFHVLGRHGAVGDIGKFPAHQERRGVRHPGGHPGTAQEPVAPAPSRFAESLRDQRGQRRPGPPRRPGPSPGSTMVLPHSAASIITPMMLLPFTIMPAVPDLDVGGELAGQLDEQRRRPGVQAQRIDDLDLARGLQRAIHRHATVRRSSRRPNRTGVTRAPKRRESAAPAAATASDRRR